MAERSKAPDSRLQTFPSLEWDRGAFWSPLGGVGSNPTPDSSFCILLQWIATEHLCITDLMETCDVWKVKLPGWPSGQRRQT